MECEDLKGAQNGWCAAYRILYKNRTIFLYIFLNILIGVDAKEDSVSGVGESSVCFHRDAVW